MSLTTFGWSVLVRIEISFYMPTISSSVILRFDKILIATLSPVSLFFPFLTVAKAPLNNTHNILNTAAYTYYPITLSIL